MRPVCYGMRSHPYLSSFFLFLNAVVYLSPSVLPAGFVLSLLYPNFYFGLYWVRRRLARGDAVHERANYSDNDRASASMDAVSCSEISIFVRSCSPVEKTSGQGKKVQYQPRVRDQAWPEATGIQESGPRVYCHTMAIPFSVAPHSKEKGRNKHISTLANFLVVRARSFLGHSTQRATAFLSYG